MKPNSIPTALVLLAIPVQAQSPMVQESPQGFAQNFYDWYAPIASKHQKSPAFEFALKRKGSLFSQNLAQALREDSAAQAKVQDDIVGIDWDPFLNTQDPVSHYEAVKVTQNGERCYVDVHSLQSGKRSEKPAVVVELAKENGHWVFVNFHSLDGHNLLGSLKSLAESREKQPK